MTDNRKNARDDRLRHALRENLKRRKAQAKGRASAPPAADDAPGEGPNGVDSSDKSASDGST
jgi:hypothetical protein